MKQKRFAKDAHSRDRNMLHKCNRARRENVASDILFYFIENSSEFPTKQNAPQDAHLAERKSSLRDPLGRERVASDFFYPTITY